MEHVRDRSFKEEDINEGHEFSNFEPVRNEYRWAKAPRPTVEDAETDERETDDEPHASQERARFVSFDKEASAFRDREEDPAVKHDQQMPRGTSPPGRRSVEPLRRGSYYGSEWSDETGSGLDRTKPRRGRTAYHAKDDYPRPYQYAKIPHRGSLYLSDTSWRYRSRRTSTETSSLPPVSKDRYRVESHTVGSRTRRDGDYDRSKQRNPLYTRRRVPRTHAASNQSHVLPPPQPLPPKRGGFPPEYHSPQQFQSPWKKAHDGTLISHPVRTERTSGLPTKRPIRQHWPSITDELLFEQQYFRIAAAYRHISDDETNLKLFCEAGPPQKSDAKKNPAFQWLHLRREPMEWSEFEEWALCAPDLDDQDRIVVEKCLLQVRTKHIRPCGTSSRVETGTALRFDHVDYNGALSQPARSVVFLCAPYFETSAKSKISSVAAISSSHHHSACGLIQTLYPLEVTLLRDHKQCYSKFSSESGKFLRVPQVWMLSVGHLLLTYAPCGAGDLQASSIKTVMLNREPGRATVARISVPNGETIYIPIDPRPSFFDLLDQIQQKVSHVGKSFLKLHSGQGNEITATSWLEFANESKDTALSITVHVDDKIQSEDLRDPREPVIKNRSEMLIDRRDSRYYGDELGRRNPPRVLDGREARRNYTFPEWIVSASHEAQGALTRQEAIDLPSEDRQLALTRAWSRADENCHNLHDLAPPKKRVARSDPHTDRSRALVPHRERHEKISEPSSRALVAYSRAIEWPEELESDEIQLGNDESYPANETSSLDGPIVLASRRKQQDFSRYQAIRGKRCLRLTEAVKKSPQDPDEVHDSVYDIYSAKEGHSERNIARAVISWDGHATYEHEISRKPKQNDIHAFQGASNKSKPRMEEGRSQKKQQDKGEHKKPRSSESIRQPLPDRESKVPNAPESMALSWPAIPFDDLVQRAAMTSMPLPEPLLTQPWKCSRLYGYLESGPITWPASSRRISYGEESYANGEAVGWGAFRGREMSQHTTSEVSLEEDAEYVSIVGSVITSPSNSDIDEARKNSMESVDIRSDNASFADSSIHGTPYEASLNSNDYPYGSTGASHSKNASMDNVPGSSHEKDNLTSLSRQELDRTKLTLQTDVETNVSLAIPPFFSWPSHSKLNESFWSEHESLDFILVDIDNRLRERRAPGTKKLYSRAFETDLRELESRHSLLSPEVLDRSSLTFPDDDHVCLEHCQCLQTKLQPLLAQVLYLMKKAVSLFTPTYYPGSPLRKLWGGIDVVSAAIIPEAEQHLMSIDKERGWNLVGNRRALLGKCILNLYRFVADFSKAAEETAHGLLTESGHSSNLHLQCSTVTAFEKFVLAFLGFCRTITFISRCYAERELDDNFPPANIEKKLEPYTQATDEACEDANVTVATARNETMAAVNSWSYSNSMSLTPIKVHDLMAEVLNNLQANVFNANHDIVTSYEICATRIQYQVNQFPRKRLLHDIHHFQEELRAVNNTTQALVELVKRFDQIIAMDNQAWQKRETLNAIAVQHGYLLDLAWKMQAKNERLQHLLHRCPALGDQVKRSVEIMEEDHGKAIWVFTTVTTVFLPLSFITSYFGMNTADMRHTNSTQGLFWAIGLPSTVVIVGVALFLAYRTDDIRQWYQQYVERLGNKTSGFEHPLALSQDGNLKPSTPGPITLLLRQCKKSSARRVRTWDTTETGMT